VKSRCVVVNPSTTLGPKFQVVDGSPLFAQYEESLINVEATAIDMDWLDGYETLEPSQQCQQELYTISGYFCGSVANTKGHDSEHVLAGKRVTGFGLAANTILANPREVILIPEDLTAAQAVFLPLFIEAARLLDRCQLKTDDRVTILGLGGLGLMVASILRWREHKDISAFDARAANRRYYQELGLNEVFEGDTLSLKTGWKRQTDGRPELVIETTGDPFIFLTILAVVADRSQIFLAGPSRGRRLDLNLYPDIHRRGIRVTGVRRIFQEKASNLLTQSEAYIERAVHFLRLNHVTFGATMPSRPTEQEQINAACAVISW
jgi:threonine dehydrogenase-like Zn-dependent dehydrogenase